MFVAIVLSFVALTISAGPATAQDAPTIAITGVDPGADTVELTNYGGADLDPNGIILCNFPAYGAIEGAPVIPAGESITVDSAAAGVALTAAGGEMGLYLTPAYEDPTQILSYVEWGEPGHQRSSVAIAAGIWSEGVADDSAGTLTASSQNPTSPTDWSAQATTTTESGGGDDELAQTGAASILVAIIGVVLLIGGLGVSRTGRRASGSDLA